MGNFALTYPKSGFTIKGQLKIGGYKDIIQLMDYEISAL